MDVFVFGHPNMHALNIQWPKKKKGVDHFDDLFNDGNLNLFCLVFLFVNVFSKPKQSFFDPLLLLLWMK